MAPNKKSTQSASAKTEAPAPKVETPAVVEKAEKKSASKKVEKAPKVEKAAEKAPATPKKEKVVKVEETEEEVTEEKKGRRVVTKQSVYDDFAALMTKITDEIAKRSPKESEDGEASKKPKRKKDAGVPIKFLKSINKRLQVLQNDASKMMKLKRESTRNNANSGLMKPVAISETLFKFLKNAKYPVEKGHEYARVEITRHIHDYVKANKLRKGDKHTDAEIAANPTLKDKRIILPDGPLAALLGYDAATAKESMTYFRLPQYLKQHFLSEKKE